MYCYSFGLENNLPLHVLTKTRENVTYVGDNTLVIEGTKAFQIFQSNIVKLEPDEDNTTVVCTITIGSSLELQGPFYTEGNVHTYSGESKYNKTYVFVGSFPTELVRSGKTLFKFLIHRGFVSHSFSVNNDGMHLTVGDELIKMDNTMFYLGG